MYYINEKRSNPEVNAVRSEWDKLKSIFRKVGYENTYISFRDGLHVADINPKNKYGTPTGFYTYPAQAYKSRIEKALEGDDTHDFLQIFPFASGRNYIYIFSIGDGAKILDNNTTLQETKYFVKKIMTLYEDLESPSEAIDSVIYNCFYYLNDSYEPTYEDKDAAIYSETNLPSHKLWLFLYEIAGLLGSKPNNRFTLLCKSIGIDGFSDNKGIGYIHKAEPYQAVFFKVKNIGKIYTVNIASEKGGIGKKGEVMNKLLLMDNNMLKRVVKSGAINPLLKDFLFVSALSKQRKDILPYLSSEQWSIIKNPNLEQKVLDELSELPQDIKDEVITSALDNMRNNIGYVSTRIQGALIANYSKPEILKQYYSTTEKIHDGVWYSTPKQLKSQMLYYKLFNNNFRKYGYSDFNSYTEATVEDYHFEAFNKEILKKYLDANGSIVPLKASYDLPADLKQYIPN
jgi:hypothetical protein